MIVGIDHFINVVKDLDAAMQVYRRLGFLVEPGGEHTAFGSHNAIVPFADGTYIELLAFRDPALAARTFWGTAVAKLQAGEGWAAFVLRSDDLAGDVEAIRNRGLEIAEPKAGSRLRPDGQTVSWRTAVAGGTPAGFLPFLIQDETPHELRVSPAQDGVGAHARVQSLVVGVKNVEVARQSYRELFDVEPTFVQNTAGDLTGYRVTAPWGSLIFAHPERKNSMADQLEKRGEGLYAVTLDVDNVNRVRVNLKKSQVKIEEDATGFLIMPQEASGARLRLV